jgi:hypothetical protein
MNVIRIEDEVFARLITCLRYHQDPENLVVELENENGDLLIYDNGAMCICYGEFYSWVGLDELVKDQRQAITMVLVEQVERVVYNIIEGVVADVG